MPAGLKPRYTPEQVAQALRDANGCRAAAARALGCHKTTVHEYIRRYPAVRAAAGESPSGKLLYTPDQIIAALEQARAVPAAARALGCSTATIVRYAGLFPQVQAVYDRYVRRKFRYTVAQVADALRQTGGQIEAAAECLGCTFQVVADYLQRHPELQAVRDEAHELRHTPRAGSGPDAPPCTPDQIAAALDQTRGSVSAAARVLGCSEDTLTHYLRHHPELRALVEDIRARRLLARPGPGPIDEVYTEQQLAGAIRRARGLLTPAARALGLPRRRLFDLVAASPFLSQVRDESRGAFAGAAISRLADAVSAGEFRAVHYSLSRFARDRGYRPVHKKRSARRAAKKKRRRASGRPDRFS